MNATSENCPRFNFNKIKASTPWALKLISLWLVIFIFAMFVINISITLFQVDEKIATGANVVRLYLVKTLQTPEERVELSNLKERVRVLEVDNIALLSRSFAAEAKISSLEVDLAAANKKLDEALIAEKNLVEAAKVKSANVSEKIKNSGVIQKSTEVSHNIGDKVRGAYERTKEFFISIWE